MLEVIIVGIVVAALLVGMCFTGVVILLAKWGNGGDD